VVGDLEDRGARAPEHRPVLAEEVVRLLDPHPGGVFVDGTVGLGGHAEALLDREPGIALVGIDRDSEALEFAAARLRRFGERAHLIRGNYRDVGVHLAHRGIQAVDGYLLDLGLSSFQLDSPERGFSFRREGPLDMRMDRSIQRTAFDLVNSEPEEELDRILRLYGEERFSRRIARAIVIERVKSPIATTQGLALLVHAAIPRRFHPARIDAATRTFQALRIAVNEELENLDEGLRAGFDVLRTGGVIAVISYHSLEDRMAKDFFRHKALACTCPPDFPVCVCKKKVEADVLTRRPILPSEGEVACNPRSRSAKLRAARKVM